MASEIKLQSGSTSTFIPGGTGTSGTRASVTFYAQEDSVAVFEYTFKFKLVNDVITVGNQYGNKITPSAYDYIVYSTPNITYLLYITEKSGDTYLTEISDQWYTQSQESESGQTIDISTIELNINCVADSIQRYIGFKKEIAQTPIKDRFNNYEIATYTGNYSKQMLMMHSSCAFTFTINSLNSIPLGQYKIQLEFVTDLTSPAMDTRIAKKFIHPRQYTGIDSYASASEVIQKKTFRGYITNYSCKGVEFSKMYSNRCKICAHTVNFVLKNGQLVSSCPQCHNEIVLTAGDTNVNPVIASENFDDEKLDNFNVTIKDYNDGNGQMSYQSTIYLPKDVIINASNAGHSYTCNMYLYVNGINGSKEKVFIRNMSNTINNEILNSDNNVYDDYRNTESTNIEQVNNNNGDNTNNNNNNNNNTSTTKYAGTAHSGVDTNILYIGNSGALDPISPYDPITPIEQESALIDDGEDSDLREVYDSVYVNNIDVQTLAGTGRWCKCSYDSANHRLKYKALSDNTTGSVRYAYFVHSTPDTTLAYGTNAGKPAMSQWTVTVAQRNKVTGNSGNGNSGGGGNGGHLQPAVNVEEDPLR